ncbi:hypothetical protein EB796_015140 [Bugula neritina]|uniref:Uncharacterized protein n=1 Tax=Bugula neritina TaxID=10212 RepID=A0A7J7JJN2_BUGNE|nr:hypothetical protein EB796_015140 [Bugula neritina]
MDKQVLELSPFPSRPLYALWEYYSPAIIELDVQLDTVNTAISLLYTHTDKSNERSFEGLSNIAVQCQ